MTIDAATFKTRFPEFSTVADARVTLFLSLALPEVGETPWGLLYEEGVFNLAAHKLQIDQNRQISNSATGGGSVGPLTSRSVGDVSVSFGLTSASSGTGNDDTLRSTMYGQEYLRLRQFAGVGMVAVL